jgi:hypothetical protein
MPMDVAVGRDVHGAMCMFIDAPFARSASRIAQGAAQPLFINPIVAGAHRARRVIAVVLFSTLLAVAATCAIESSVRRMLGVTPNICNLRLPAARQSAGELIPSILRISRVCVGISDQIRRLPASGRDCRLRTLLKLLTLPLNLRAHPCRGEPSAFVR